MISLKKHNRESVTWPVLKAFHDLYIHQRTTVQIQEGDFVSYLLNQTELISQKKGKAGTLVAGEGYAAFYESEFKEVYQHYFDFLSLAGIKPDARKNFTEEDIRTLMMIYESRHELKGRLSNIEDFSGKIFDYGGSKYLKFRDSVRNAVLKILEIDDFPMTSKDLQYRLVVDHTDPKAVILCENKSFLKQPWNAKELEVKLWHVGGNNIAIIDDIDAFELNYPIYYSCDWDLHGLQIYLRIKTKLQHRGADIRLLMPAPPHRCLPSASFKHKSRWDFSKVLSGLDYGKLSAAETALIQELITNDQWIEEESNVLKEMYLYNTTGPRSQ
jgi:hypothetical protein